MTPAGHPALVLTRADVPRATTSRGRLGTHTARDFAYARASEKELLYRSLLASYPQVVQATVRARIILGFHLEIDRAALAAALGFTGTPRDVSVQVSRAITAARKLLAPARSTPATQSATGMLTWLCVECGTRFPALASRGLLYCQNRCRETGKYVRYHRGVIARFGDVPFDQLPADIREGLLQKRPHLLGDGPGYDAGARRLTPSRRAQVVARDGGRCVKCSASGEEIDHIDGDSADLSNLRLLCQSCHHEVTRSHWKPADARSRQRAAELDRRVHAEHPLHPQDDAALWSQVSATWVVDHATLLATR